MFPCCSLKYIGQLCPDVYTGLCRNSNNSEAREKIRLDIVTISVGV